jgi:hypothetical protein
MIQFVMFALMAFTLSRALSFVQQVAIVKQHLQLNAVLTVIATMVHFVFHMPVWPVGPIPFPPRGSSFNVVLTVIVVKVLLVVKISVGRSPPPV